MYIINSNSSFPHIELKSKAGCDASDILQYSHLGEQRGITSDIYFWKFPFQTDDPKVVRHSGNWLAQDRKWQDYKMRCLPRK